MAKAWHIRLKKQIRGYDPDEVVAKPHHPNVAKAMKRLDTLATLQGWAPLSSFLSEDPEVAMDLVDDEDEWEELDLPPVKWFPADAALSTIEKMIPAITELPMRVGLHDAKHVLAELTDLRETLSRAVAKKIAFRFYAEFG